MIEALFALPLFLILLLATFDLLLAGYSLLSIQFVLTRTMRESTVNKWSATQIQENVISNLKGFNVAMDLDAHDVICMQPVDRWSSTCKTIDPGASVDLMVLSATKQITGLNVLRMIGSIAGIDSQNLVIRGMVMGRNEPT